jgi:hypothetical protein
VRPTRIPVYLEIGRTRVFASAIDWPGWTRSGKTPERAIEALAEYAARYQPVVELAGLTGFPDIAGPLSGGDEHQDGQQSPEGSHAALFEVVEQVAGTATTEFGAPDRAAGSDADPVSAEQAARFGAIVAASWQLLDSVVASSPAELRKGPRGGGRDRDAVVAHVLGAEAAYARKSGLRQPTPTPGDQVALRDMRAGLLSTLTEGGGADGRWSRPYATRRIAWHVLDHAWEIQDRSV